MKTTVPELNLSAMQQCQHRWNQLLKPVGSLGRLEEIVIRLAGVKGDPMPDIHKKRIVIFAADHGVAAEGVSAYPQEVTMQMVRNFLEGRAAICVLAKLLDIELQVVDLGVLTELHDARLFSCRSGNGTASFLHGPAMTLEQRDNAMETGMRFAREAAKQNVDLAGAGDMGIGNSASASAIYAALLEFDVASVTGKGAGLDEKGRRHKVEILERALLNRSIPTDPLEVLRHYGGFEIAAITGFYLGAAENRMPVVVDGFICGAAAAIAMKFLPRCKSFLFFGHASSENGHRKALQALDASPLFDLQMRLGEGTGAALAMKLIEAAVRLYRDLPTFEEAQTNRSHLP